VRWTVSETTVGWHATVHSADVWCSIAGNEVGRVEARADKEHPRRFESVRYCRIVRECPCPFVDGTVLDFFVSRTTALNFGWWCYMFFGVTSRRMVARDAFETRTTAHVDAITDECIPMSISLVISVSYFFVSSISFEKDTNLTGRPVHHHRFQRTGNGMKIRIRHFYLEVKIIVQYFIFNTVCTVSIKTVSPGECYFDFNVTMMTISYIYEYHQSTAA